MEVIGIIDACCPGIVFVDVIKLLTLVTIKKPELITFNPMDCERSGCYFFMR